MSLKQIVVALLLMAVSWWGVGCTAVAPTAVAVDARDLDIFSEEVFCSYEPDDIEAGKILFNQPVLGGFSGCINCHSIEPNHQLMGPSLYNIADTAVGRIPEITPPTYLYFSITRPDQYIVEGFSPGIMPAHYGENLTETELTNIVSYLMTLTQEN